MATGRPVRAMDRYTGQFGVFTLSKELRLQHFSASGEVSVAAGPDLRPLPIRRFHMVRAPRQGEGALLDDVPARLLPGISTALALELAEGPLFVSWPLDIEPSDLREGHDAGAPVDGRHRPVRQVRPAGLRPAVQARLTRSDEARRSDC
jgi:hypothetical protein